MPTNSYDPNNKWTQMVNGELYMWVPDQAPDPTNQQSTYGGNDFQQSTEPGQGAGQWVPSTYFRQNGVSPWKFIAAMAAAGAGGQAIADAIAATAGGGIAGGISSGASGAGGGAAASMPAAVGGIPAGASFGGASALPALGAAGIGSGEAGSVAGQSLGPVLSGGANASASEGAGGGLMSKIMGKFSGRDLVSAGLGVASLFGKDPDPFQKRTSFAGTGADPVRTLTDSLSAIKNLSATIASHGQPSLRQATVQDGPAPVTIPGIPFQIGGGFGSDPALKDPTMLDSKPIADPFGSTAQPAQPQAPTARRRNP